MSFRNRRRKENPKTHPLESESGPPRFYFPFIVRATRQDPPSGKREWGTQRLPPIFRPGHPPVEGVIGQAHGVERNRVAVNIPGVVVAAIVGDIPVSVVGWCSPGKGGEAVGGRAVGRLKAVGTAGFADVAECIVGKSLRG